MFDIIGDVHGKADSLKILLEKLGYTKTGGCYSHPGRKAIFTGDFINRGKKVRQTLKIVSRMVERKAAYAVMGNHEYNFICYHTKSYGRGYLKKHNSSNRSFFYYTSKAFEGRPEKLRKYLEWMKTLPLFLEFEHFRVVHACWNKRLVRFVKNNLPGNRITESFLHNSAREGTIENEVVNVLLTGVEIKLDKPVSVINALGNKVESMRIKWWMDPGRRHLSAVALGDYKISPDRPLRKAEKNRFLPYAEDKKPVFIGHYCLRETPRLQASNLCCIDFCCYRNGYLAAYRMEGETALRPENLVFV
jgi:hypothetical protein